MWTVGRSKDWKTGSCVYCRGTCVQNSLRNVVAENYHRQNKNKKVPKTRLFRNSTAQWESRSCLSVKNSFRWGNLCSSLGPMMKRKSLDGNNSHRHLRKKLMCRLLWVNNFWRLPGQWSTIVSGIRGDTFNTERYMRAFKKLRRIRRVRHNR